MEVFIEDISHFVRNFFYSAEGMASEQQDFCESINLIERLEEIHSLERSGLKDNYLLWENMWKELSQTFGERRYLFFFLVVCFGKRLKELQNYARRTAIDIRYAVLLETLAVSAECAN